METTEKPKRKLDLSKALSTRNGTLAVAGISALLAGALLMVFLNQYRDSTGDDGAPASVLVAERLIERGTSGDVLADEGMFRRATVPRGDLKDGAIVDPASIKGKVASGDVYPGEQLTTGQFTAAAPRALNKLDGDQRAIAIPTDAVHGNTAELRAGDRVDVFGGFNVDSVGGANDRPVLKPLMRNVLVLRAPGGGSNQPGSSGTNVVLKAPDSKAAEFAFAADNGKVWLLLRPQAGGRDSDIPLVTLESVLFGVRPIQLERQFGAAR
jgi:Flp pilus assembly protein CpaB